MRAKKVAAFVLMASAVGFAAGRTTGSASLHAQTKKNLDTAMHGEAFAYAKYLLFAQQARQEGHPEVAQLFERTANVEKLEHFKEEAKLAGIVGSTEDNLRNAIGGESYENTQMYKQFAQQAAACGDQQAASRFDEIRRDEGKHRAEYQAALNRLQTQGQGRKAPTP